MPSVKEVSKAVLQQSATPISNLKLQKLLYYVQGWSLAIHGKPAFHERIEAWVHGPVVPAAFYEYRDSAWNPISIPPGQPALTRQELDHVDVVLAAYGEFTATQLESLSHEESPWLDARIGLDPKTPSKAEISHDSMKKFFLARLNA